MAVAVGQSTYFLRTFGLLLRLQSMGMDFNVPTAYKPSDENCKPALMDSCMCFRGEGLQTQKDNKNRKSFHRKALHPSSSRDVNSRQYLSGVEGIELRIFGPKQSFPDFVDFDPL